MLYPLEACLFYDNPVEALKKLRERGYLYPHADYFASSKRFLDILKRLPTEPKLTNPRLTLTDAACEKYCENYEDWFRFGACCSPDTQDLFSENEEFKRGTEALDHHQLLNLSFREILDKGGEWLDNEQFLISLKKRFSLHGDTLSEICSDYLETNTSEDSLINLALSTNNSDLLILTEYTAEDIDWSKVRSAMFIKYLFNSLENDDLNAFEVINGVLSTPGEGKLEPLLERFNESSFSKIECRNLIKTALSTLSVKDYTRFYIWLVSRSSENSVNTTEIFLEASKRGYEYLSSVLTEEYQLTVREKCEGLVNAKSLTMIIENTEDFTPENFTYLASLMCKEKGVLEIMQYLIDKDVDLTQEDFDNIMEQGDGKVALLLKDQFDTTKFDERVAFIPEGDNYYQCDLDKLSIVEITDHHNCDIMIGKSFVDDEKILFRYKEINPQVKWKTVIMSAEYYNNPIISAFSKSM